MSLLLAVFLIVFVTQLISWIGQNVLLEWAYSLYLTVTRSSLAAKQKALKTEILNNKSELLRTSAQDQFAKWAKLRRSVDKGLADLEKLNSEMSSAKSSFSMKFKGVMWFLTTGVELVIGWWFRRQPVFYLPDSWLGPLTWWLSFPFAPKGSVSVGVWSIACKRVLGVLERTVKTYFEPTTSPVPSRDTSPGPKSSSNTSRKATVETDDEDEKSS
ncbi:hypothetical protein FA13DRAFT_1735605 [Coprinellus micaceus]|uniref:Uncharacterized protein n=1 Tax=Coprinellus micaceus TaxID=71717 RepID=A0A4Y7T3C0_COPMI|nr:hypothetical protein FA13DRAFT_1735605 [Coprinellus micaceus]